MIALALVAVVAPTLLTFAAWRRAIVRCQGPRLSAPTRLEVLEAAAGE